MMRCLGSPVALSARYVIVSMGLETTTRMISGEYFRRFSATSRTILALVPISSSRVMTGLRGIPEVMTDTAETAVLLSSLVTPVIVLSYPKNEAVCADRERGVKGK